MFNTDTIAATATAMGSSGIGIIRISGEEAIQIAESIFESPKGKKLSQVRSHTINYGHILFHDKIVDEVMVSIMRAPNSYTREDTVEINCHGGILVLNAVLEAVVEQGARLADPGEFTKRAFINGRIDLTQAESVIDIINAKNTFALSTSMEQLHGAVSKKIKNLRSVLIHEIASIESALDDPEHMEIEHYHEKIQLVLAPVIEEMEDLLIQSDHGAVLKEGIHTVIVGKPNAGKSSLMNALVRKEKAIVTDIAGTTRDIIEEQIMLNGISLNIIDTAGIRETEDKVEKIGVDKARIYVDKADLIIFVVDASNNLSQEDHDIIEMIKDKRVIVLMNKSDLNAVTSVTEIERYLNHSVISVSAKDGVGIDLLEDKIIEMFFSGSIQMNDQVFITNMRQKQLLKESLGSLYLVRQSAVDEMPEDFYSIDLMNAYEQLGKMVGETVEEDLINEIFSKFCMGK